MLDHAWVITVEGQTPPRYRGNGEITDTEKGGDIMKAEITIILTNEEWEALQNDGSIPGAIRPCWLAYGQEEELRVMGIKIPSRSEVHFRVLLEDGTDVTSIMWVYN
jgi:hypothetical protein